MKQNDAKHWLDQAAAHDDLARREGNPEARDYHHQAAADFRRRADECQKSEGKENRT